MSLIATVYARALLDLADERGKRDAVVADCRAMAGGRDQEGPIESLEIRQRLEDPRLGKEKSKDVLRSAFTGKIETETLDLMLLLIDRNRLPDTGAILDEVVDIADREAGVQKIQVYTAGEISAASVEQLGVGLRRILGQQVRIEHTIKPELIGGVTVRVGDLHVDGSVRRQLDNMKTIILDAPVSDRLWA